MLPLRRGSPGEGFILRVEVGVGVRKTILYVYYVGATLLTARSAVVLCLLPAPLLHNLSLPCAPPPSGSVCSLRRLWAKSLLQKQWELSALAAALAASAAASASVAASASAVAAASVCRKPCAPFARHFSTEVNHPIWSRSQCGHRILSFINQVFGLIKSCVGGKNAKRRERKKGYENSANNNKQQAAHSDTL